MRLGDRWLLALDAFDLRLHGRWRARLLKAQGNEASMHPRLAATERAMLKLHGPLKPWERRLGDVIGRLADRLLGAKSTRPDDRL